MKALFVPVGFLLAASLVMLSSIDVGLFYLQGLWILLGIAFVVFFWIVDWRSLFNYTWVTWALYGLVLVLLILVYLKGPVIRNVRGWLEFGPLRFQPVELAKVSLILLYARFFSRRHISVARWKYIFASFFYFAAPAALVVIQPDLGSALVLFGVWFGFLLVSGLSRKRLAITILALAVAGVALWNFGLATYQKERIQGVFYPQHDILGINYSQNQAKIAIGSAGFFGKGFGQGTQTQLGYLTEPESDFIFVAFIEEWGWSAGILAILAFVAAIGMILKIGLRADTNFEKFICLGTATVFGVHFFVNAGSATGLFPVVGVPFPFLSYGGSNLLMNFFLLSLVNAIALRS